MERGDKLVTEDETFLADAIETLLATIFTYANTRRDLVQKPLLLCLNTIYTVIQDPRKYKASSKLIES